MNSKDFNIYLPKYLSDEEVKVLFEDLKKFPNNIDSRFYSFFSIDDAIVYQGDGIKNIPTFNLPEIESKKTNNLVLSNTCDIDLDNDRKIPSRILFTPIISLSKIEENLLKKFPKQKVETFLESIRKQEITQILFLPKNENTEDSIIFFDRTNSLPNSIIDRNEAKNLRIFSLSQFGFYIFLIKLSIHFTRVKEGVRRK